MRKSLVIIAVLLTFLVGCSSSPITPDQGADLSSTKTITPIPISPLASPQTISPFPTPPITESSTIKPEPTVPRTPRPTSTQTPLPTDTPTLLPPELFNPALSSTRTPSNHSLCPQINPDVNLDREALIPDDMAADYSPTVLQYLNDGGDPAPLLDFYRDKMHFFLTKDDQVVYQGDLTQDSVPELIISWNSLFIFGCREEKYVTLFALPAEEVTMSPSTPIIEFVEDINLDGVPEIILYSYGCDMGRCPKVFVYEWDALGFRELLYPTEIDGNPKDSGCRDMPQPFRVQVRDTDRNGTKEILLHAPLPPASYDLAWDYDFYMQRPLWRDEVRTCMWNGEYFELVRKEYSAPRYRFQAVQDGDRAVLAGEYDKALDFYQQTIFNDQLDWLTEERLLNIMIQNTTAFRQDTTPTPLPNDPTEYLNLAAYARYRIMLLHIFRGWMAEAETVYLTLQEEYPKEQPGYEFAEMASLFWQEYQARQNMKQACLKAIHYASTHSEILSYLEGPFYWQSLDYVPQDICPYNR